MSFGKIEIMRMRGGVIIGLGSGFGLRLCLLGIRVRVECGPERIFLLHIFLVLSHQMFYLLLNYRNLNNQPSCSI